PPVAAVAEPSVPFRPPPPGDDPDRRAACRGAHRPRLGGADVRIRSAPARRAAAPGSVARRAPGNLPRGRTAPQGRRREGRRAVGLDWTTVFTRLGIGGLAVTLATKEFLGNFIRGVVMMVDSPLRIGDLIKLEDKTFRVVDMSFRYVILQEGDGEFTLVTYS